MNGRAYALSRRIDLMQTECKTDQPLLRLAALESSSPVWSDDHILERVRKAITEDVTLEPLLTYFNDTSKLPANIRHRFEDYTFTDQILRFQNMVYVLDDEELRRQILRSRQDAPAAGHQGQAKTLELVTRTFYWPTVRLYNNRYVDGCDNCQRSKPTHHSPYGLMQPIPTAHAPWKRISIDFIVNLRISKGYDSVMVVVDKNAKLDHFISTNESINSQETTSLFLQHVWKHDGTPEEVISNRGPLFISKFMTRLCELLRIKPSPMTTFHPQANGQTERINQTLEQIFTNIHHKTP